MTDCLLSLRPSLVLYSTLSEANEALAQLEKTFKNKLGEDEGGEGEGGGEESDDEEERGYGRGIPKQEEEEEEGDEVC